MQGCLNVTYLKKDGGFVDESDSPILAEGADDIETPVLIVGKDGDGAKEVDELCTSWSELLPGGRAEAISYMGIGLCSILCGDSTKYNFPMVEITSRMPPVGKSFRVSGIACSVGTTSLCVSGSTTSERRLRLSVHRSGVVVEDDVMVGESGANREEFRNIAQFKYDRQDTLEESP